ncbi:MAG: esterase [Anaerolineae bacterium]|nr:esterase [Anaerolineae bacterium]
MAEPVVILGGFLSYDLLYAAMAEALETISGAEVVIVETRSLDWLGAALPLGWRPLLDKLHRAVQAATSTSPTGKVTLVAHSAGGVLSRIYLSPQPFLGKAYSGLDTVSQVITLGSPHDGGGKLIYGGVMSRWANRRYPGAYFDERVSYVSVAGSSLCGNLQGSRRERQAYRLYKDMIGEGEVCGDGVVPVPSAVLPGSHVLVLPGVGHFSGFGPTWYGDENVVRRWWEEASKVRPQAPATAS